MDTIYQLQGIAFEWDADKAQSNIEKHGVTFAEAAEVFFDPFYQSGDATEEGEPREFILGYSGAEYEHKAAMLEQATQMLDQFEPRQTIVNIGATPEGIGAVYETAKQKGFLTTGIVSTQAQEHHVTLSPCVDLVFFVRDATWGGFIPGTEQLSPTSTAMVENSDVIVAIGGGEVARDELMAAKRLGKAFRFLPADMNHQIARDRALKRGQAAPTDFRGAAGAVF